MFRLSGFALLVCVALAGGCGGDDGDGDDDDDAQGCTQSQVEVAYLGDGEDRKECAAIPSACGSTADCASNACRSALYDLCEAGWQGVGCSDTSAPTIVSCNP